MDKQAATIIRIIQVWFKDEGLPEEVICDKEGKNSKNDIADYLKNLGIKLTCRR